MLKKLVFDIETKNTFQDTGSRKPESLDLSVIAIYDYDTDKYLSFSENELKDLWPYIDKSVYFNRILNSSLFRYCLKFVNKVFVLFVNSL